MNIETRVMPGENFLDHFRVDKFVLKQMRKDQLAMGDIQEEFLSHPFSSLLKPFGMAGRAEAPRLAGKSQKILRSAIGAADAGKT
jgi:hypothetical protein